MHTQKIFFFLRKRKKIAKEAGTYWHHVSQLTRTRCFYSSWQGKKRAPNFTQTSFTSHDSSLKLRNRGSLTWFSTWKDSKMSVQCRQFKIGWLLLRLKPCVTEVFPGKLAAAVENGKCSKGPWADSGGLCHTILSKASGERESPESSFYVELQQLR